MHCSDYIASNTNQWERDRYRMTQWSVNDHWQHLWEEGGNKKNHCVM